MGARESRPQGAGETNGEAAPPDYYTLLEVDENATQDEIRVRHSDPGNIERIELFFSS